jgi:hypothetical protein
MTIPAATFIAVIMASRLAGGRQFLVLIRRERPQL